MNLSAYRPMDLIVIGLAVLVLLVIGGQVLGLVRHNRASRRAPKTRRHTVVERDDADPWQAAALVSGRRA